MAVDDTVYIAAPPALVWSLIDDPEKLPLWMPDVIETIYPNGRPKKSAVGTLFIQRVKDGMRLKTYDGVVTAFAPGRQLAIELTETMYTIAVSYTLAPQGSGTRLQHHGDLTMHNAMMRMMATMMWPVTAGILRRQVGNLKVCAEQLALDAPRSAKAPKPAVAKAAPQPTRKRASKLGSKLGRKLAPARKTKRKGP